MHIFEGGRDEDASRPPLTSRHICHCLTLLKKGKDKHHFGWCGGDEKRRKGETKKEISGDTLCFGFCASACVSFPSLLSPSFLVSFSESLLVSEMEEEVEVGGVE